MKHATNLSLNGFRIKTCKCLIRHDPDAYCAVSPTQIVMIALKQECLKRPNVWMHVDQVKPMAWLLLREKATFTMRIDDMTIFDDGFYLI